MDRKPYISEDYERLDKLATERNDRKSVNELNPNIAAESIDKKHLHALAETLDRFHIMKRSYAILKDQDEAVCMVYHEGQWKVYFSERGHEIDCRHATDIEEACSIMLYRLSEDQEAYTKMTDYFKREVEITSDD